MSARGVLLIGLVLPIWSSVSCCDVNDRASITLCVTKFLEDGRDQEKPRIGSMFLQTTRGHGELEHWEVQNPTVKGLGAYLFEGLVVNVEKRRAITVGFVPKWPSITLHAGVEYVFCKRLNNTFSSSCVQPVGSVTIFAINPNCNVTVRVERLVTNGYVVVNPRSHIDVNFFSINVNLAMDEYNQNIDKGFGSPSVKFRNELTSYWRNTAGPAIAKKIRSQLNKVIYSYVAQGLSRRTSFFN